MATTEKRTSEVSILEKPHVSAVRQSLDSLEEGAKFGAAQTKQLLRKMDVNLVPFLALLYLHVVS